jgi:hypothetical protein
MVGSGEHVLDATQLAMKAPVHAPAGLHVLHNGTASTHLVDLSMTVKGTRDHLKMPEEDPPGPRVRGRTCVRVPEWRGVEL